MKLSKEFFLQDTQAVAKELLGKVFVKNYNGKLISGRITETEAYLPSGDLSSHSAVGKTQRNSPMFEDGGILYVYMIYGIHHCINFVTEETGKGAAVLIRAMQPLEGIEYMQKQRPNCKQISKLLSGPANIAKAFAFTKADNNKSLFSNELYIYDDGFQITKNDIIITERIGITKSKELPLRFYLRNSESVSGRKLSKQSAYII